MKFEHLGSKVNIAKGELFEEVGGGAGGELKGRCIIKTASLL